MAAQPSHTNVQADVQRAVNALQLAFARVLAEMPDTRLKDLSARHGLSRTLAWKILRLSHAPDALADAALVPGPRGTKIFIEAARTSGVRELLLRDLQTAWDDFHTVAGRHTQSRPQMRSLAAGMAPSGDPSLVHRKAATRANSYIWGAHTRVFYVGLWLFDASTTGTPNEKSDLVMISGPIGLKSMWPGRKVMINRMRANALANPNIQPLVPRPKNGTNLSILPEFSSNPLPAIDVVTLPDGVLLHEFTPSTVNDSTGLDLLFGIRIQQGEYHKLPAPEPAIGVLSNLTRPCDLLVLELYLDTTIYLPSRVWAVVLDALQSKQPQRENSFDCLQIPCDVVSRESATLAPPISQVPKHQEMRDFVFDKAGVPASRFRYHSFSLPFPPIPSVPTLNVELLYNVL